jgi:2-octaprenylphenol hydroxylase
MADYDVIIVGAGMVGASAACLLSKAVRGKHLTPIKIALVEANVVLPFNEDDFDPRVAAITEKSRKLLARCDAWSTIENLRVSPYVSMEVWDAESTGKISFDSCSIHEANLGHIVESTVVVEALLEKIDQLDNIDFICPASISNYDRCNEEITVVLDDGRTMTAALLIGADGGNSKVRRHFNFECKEWDYQQEAIVATVKTQNSNQKTAWQRFTPSGPLALLPLNKQSNLQYSSVVWSQDSPSANALAALDDAQFCIELTKASESCLGEILSVGPRYSFPLRQRHAIHYVQERVALIGDSAHTVHPLAGQGVNLGFSDVEVLIEELERALLRGIDVGDKKILKRYQRRRKPENLAIMALMEVFKRLFAADQLSLRFLRSKGMSQLDGIRPLKNEIIRRAMGL